MVLFVYSYRKVTHWFVKGTDHFPKLFLNILYIPLFSISLLSCLAQGARSLILWRPCSLKHQTWGTLSFSVTLSSPQQSTFKEIRIKRLVFTAAEREILNPPGLHWDYWFDIVCRKWITTPNGLCSLVSSLQVSWFSVFQWDLSGLILVVGCG